MLGVADSIAYSDNEGVSDMFGYTRPPCLEPSQEAALVSATELLGSKYSKSDATFWDSFLGTDSQLEDLTEVSSGIGVISDRQKLEILLESQQVSQEDPAVTLSNKRTISRISIQSGALVKGFHEKGWRCGQTLCAKLCRNKGRCTEGRVHVII